VRVCGIIGVRTRVRLVLVSPVVTEVTSGRMVAVDGRVCRVFGPRGGGGAGSAAHGAGR